MHSIESFSEQDVRQILLDEIACAIACCRMSQGAKAS
jgi:hypothetical protein